MNQDYEVFYNGLKGLTNAEALAEITKKLAMVVQKRRENNRATIMEEQLKKLLDKTKDSEQGEMFVVNEKFKRR